MLAYYETHSGGEGDSTMDCRLGQDSDEAAAASGVREDAAAAARTQGEQAALRGMMSDAERAAAHERRAEGEHLMRIKEHELTLATA